eukprot:scaffold37454_cov72-Phaeocystis_antarctica.AAC.1
MGSGKKLDSKGFYCSGPSVRVRIGHRMWWGRRRESAGRGRESRVTAFIIYQSVNCLVSCFLPFHLTLFFCFSNVTRATAQIDDRVRGRVEQIGTHHSRVELTNTDAQCVRPVHRETRGHTAAVPDRCH